jgi:hypothetical protein
MLVGKKIKLLPNGPKRKSTYQINQIDKPAQNMNPEHPQFIVD